MKLYLDTTAVGGDMLKDVLQAIVHTAGHVVVESVEEAELLVVMGSPQALRYLEGGEGKRILVATLNGDDVRAGQSLAEEYPERVVARPLLSHGHGPEANVGGYLDALEPKG